MEGTHLRTLFEADPQRFDKFTLRLDDLLFDFSKHLVTEETLALLVELAVQVEVPQFIERMFRGERINLSERRPVLHVALRNRSNRPIEVDGEDVMPLVNQVLDKMRRLPKTCVAARGRATLANPLPTSSTSGLEVRTSDR